MAMKIRRKTYDINGVDLLSDDAIEQLEKEIEEYKAKNYHWVFYSSINPEVAVRVLKREDPEEAREYQDYQEKKKKYEEAVDNREVYNALKKAEEGDCYNSEKDGESVEGHWVKTLDVSPNGTKVVFIKDEDFGLTAFVKVEVSGGKRVDKEKGTKKGRYKLIRDAIPNKDDEGVINIESEGGDDVTKSSTVKIEATDAMKALLPSLITSKEIFGFAKERQEPAKVSEIEKEGGEDMTKGKRESVVESVDSEVREEVSVVDPVAPDGREEDKAGSLKSEEPVSMGKPSAVKKHRGIEFLVVGVGVLLTAGIITMGVRDGLNTLKDFSGHSLDDAVIEKVSDDLNLDGKTVSAFTNNYEGVVYSVGNPWVVGATPLDVLKEKTEDQTAVFSKKDGNDAWHGAKAYGRANKQALVENIALAFAKDVSEEYKNAGRTVNAYEPKYPITVNHTDASTTEGFVEILNNIHLEKTNGSQSKLSEAQIDAVIEYYSTSWEDEATKISEERDKVSASAQAAADAKANAKAQAEASIDAAIRSEFSSTVGEYNIDWNTGEFVAWSADKDREYRYSGQSNDLIKNFDAGETITPEEIAEAINGAKITKSQKLENYIGDLFEEGKTYSTKKTTFETRLETKRNSDQVKYAADSVEYYVDLNTAQFDDKGKMTTTYYVDCYEQNEGTKAYEYFDSKTVKGEAVVTKGTSSPDKRVGTVMSMFDNLTFKNSGVSREEDTLVK